MYAQSNLSPHDAGEVSLNAKPLSPKISAKKFYGKYLHALIAHGPLMVCIVSGKSANTEQEERTFNTMKTTTTSKSNFHPDHVILNVIIKLQVKEDFDAAYTYNSESMVEHEVFILMKT